MVDFLRKALMDLSLAGNDRAEIEVEMAAAI
jgi:hypothetical protein